MSSADPVVDVPGRVRAAMVVIGFIPFLHAAGAIAPLVSVLLGGQIWRVWLAPVVLFLLPPLLVRAATWRRRLRVGRVDLTSGWFLHWWFTSQCQVVFSRLPWLEEILRLVPALYSAWLRLWGAQVGALVYWSPGVAILDRSLVRIGNRVVLGAGVRLSAHALAPVQDGGGALFLGPITIGDDALIGAYSLLMPGCEIAPGEVTPPLRSVHAFTRLQGGRRVRLETSPALGGDRWES